MNYLNQYTVLLLMLCINNSYCSQKDPILNRTLAESRRTYKAEQQKKSLYQKQMTLAKQKSLLLSKKTKPSYYTIKQLKLSWWERIKRFWSRKKETNIDTIKSSAVYVYDWSPYVYRQRDGVSCGLHAIKNGYHVAQYLRSKKFGGDYDALIKSISSPPHTRICRFGYPLAKLKQSLGLGTTETLNYMLLSDNVYKSAHDVFGLTKEDLTVIASTKNFKSSNFELGFFTTEEANALKKLQRLVKNRKPIIHIFVLGNMEEISTTSGIRGTSGHWITLVVEVDTKGSLSLHYVNSFGKDQEDFEYKVSVIKELLVQ